MFVVSAIHSWKLIFFYDMFGFLFSRFSINLLKLLRGNSSLYYTFKMVSMPF